MVSDSNLQSTKNGEDKKMLPLVYSCSGCSNLAQMANDIALKMHRGGEAEMSCIAGVGGNVKALVKKAKSGRRIIAIDGCPLHCVRLCLERHGILPHSHHTLTDFGGRKQNFEEYDDEEFVAFYHKIQKDVDPVLQ